MQRAIMGQEQLAFVGAEQSFAADPRASQPIIDMMRLAMEGVCDDIRERASAWLFRNVGVKVVHERGDSATSAKAANIR